MAYRFAGTVLIVILFCLPAYAGKAPERIVSLAPSMTEMLYAIGLGDRVVAVTTFCDHPPEAKEKPKIGGMSNPSLEAVVSMRPDIVAMTTDGNPQGFDRRLHALGIETYVFKARRIAELPDSVREMGRAFDAEEKANELADRFAAALKKYEQSRIPRGSALYVVWPEPLIVAGPGTVIDDVLDLLGFTNVAGESAINYPKYSVEEALRQMPEYIFVGKGMNSDMVGLSEKFLSKLKNTPAVENDRVFFVSDSLYRFGPRVMMGMEELSDILNMNEGGRKQ